MLGIALLLAAGGVWFFFLVQAARLFTLRVEDGQIVSVSGNLPPRLLAELRDVVERARLPKAQLVGLSRGGAPAIQSDVQLPAGVEQQLRNVLGQFTVAQIRNGQKH